MKLFLFIALLALSLADEAEKKKSVKIEEPLEDLEAAASIELLKTRELSENLEGSASTYNAVPPSKKPRQWNQFNPGQYVPTNSPFNQQQGNNPFPSNGNFGNYIPSGSNFNPGNYIPSGSNINPGNYISNNPSQYFPSSTFSPGNYFPSSTPSPGNYFPSSTPGNFIPNLPQGGYFPQNLSPPNSIQSDTPVSTQAPTNNYQPPQNTQNYNPPNNNYIPPQNDYKPPQNPAPVNPQAPQNDYYQNQWTTTTQNSVIKNDLFFGDNGSYKYEYQLTDGTWVGEEGYIVNPNTEQESLVKKGWYSYYGADGKKYTVTYWAGDSGYYAYGDHLPTPPPVPPAIQAAIDQAAKEEEAKQQAEQNKPQQYPQQPQPYPQQPQPYPQQPQPYPQQPQPYPQQPQTYPQQSQPTQPTYYPQQTYRPPGYGK